MTRPTEHPKTGSSSVLDGCRVLVGVTGGIAAYKAAALVSILVQRGSIVSVAMTPGATRFVSPLTFEALSGQIGRASCRERV